MMRTPGFHAQAALPRARLVLRPGRAAPAGGPAGRVVPAGPVYQYEGTLYCCYPCGYYADGSYQWCCPPCGTSSAPTSSRLPLYLSS